MKDIKVSSKAGGESGSACEGESRLRRGAAHALWFLSTTRNILVVLVCAALAYYFDTQRQSPFVLTGKDMTSTLEFTCATLRSFRPVIFF